MKYDIALSFAGEERAFVNEVASILREAGIKVFYDDYESTNLWGKDLYTHLDAVYRTLSQYCVMFVSASYKEKVWTNHERTSAQARAIEENDEYILPVRFDETEIPGLRPTIGYLDGNKLGPSKVAEMIKQKVGPLETNVGFPPKIDRLYAALDLKGPKARDAKKSTKLVAISFYEALQRMSIEERKVVGGVLAFGCPGELPEGVHISLDLLARMTGLSQVEILESLSNVRSLNVFVKMRNASSVHTFDEEDLVPDDKDLLVRFWSPREPEAKNPTKIVYLAVNEAASHYCADHGLETIVNLDFRRLSGKNAEAADVTGVSHAV